MNIIRKKTVELLGHNFVVGTQVKTRRKKGKCDTDKHIF